MRILIYTEEQQTYQSLSDTIRLLHPGAAMEVYHADDYDLLRRILAQQTWSLVIVAQPGAKGMEVCIGARKIRPQIPLVWFSDDLLFAAQSYRLDCTYFGKLPGSQRSLAEAFSRVREGACGCRRLG